MNKRKEQGRVINGAFRALLFIIQDYIISVIKAKKTGYNFGTYRLWWFDSEKSRKDFFKEHGIPFEEKFRTKGGEIT